MIIKYIKVVSIFLIAAFCFTACKSLENETKIEASYSKSKTLDEAIGKFFNPNDSIQVIPNNGENFEIYLVESAPDPAIPINNIIFFIYDKVNEKILYANNYTRATIQWHNDIQLLLIRNLGIIDKQTGLSTKRFIIDLANNKTLEYFENKKQDQ